MRAALLKIENLKLTRPKVARSAQTFTPFTSDPLPFP